LIEMQFCFRQILNFTGSTGILKFIEFVLTLSHNDPSSATYTRAPFLVFYLPAVLPIVGRCRYPVHHKMSNSFTVNN
jgi:hypothetical protein